eukprot:5626108-Pyramimonas_sp.AAC.1
MSLKAAESALMLEFVMDLLPTKGGIAVFGPHLLGAGAALQSFMQLMREYPVLVPPDVQHHMNHYMNIHVRCAKAALIALVPKHHQACHLADRMAKYESNMLLSSFSLSSFTRHPSTPSGALLLLPLTT